MLLKLFDVESGVVKPTPHCYTISYLKDIMDVFPEEYMKIYAFIFYMTCPNAELNPFFNIRESDKEEVIYKAIGADFSLEEPLIAEALENCKALYETAGYRAYLGMKEALDKISDYLRATPISHGRDGNLNSIVLTAKNFPAIKAAFDKSYEDLKKEQQVRGGKDLGYDQRGKSMNDDDVFDTNQEEEE